MDKVAYGTWQIVQISEINKQQTNSVEYKCSAKSLSRLFKVTRSVQCCTSDRCLSQCVCVSVCECECECECECGGWWVVVVVVGVRVQ